MHTTLLVDGDILIFNQAAAKQHAYDWGDDVWGVSANLDEAKEGVISDLSALKNKLEADHAIICFTDSVNWRKSVYPAYKSNRKAAPKPILLTPLRAFCEETMDTKSKPTLEADDVMGIMATAPGVCPGSTKIICSIDKDMMQIPGLVFDGEVVHHISPEMGHRLHLMQTLTGDVVDGYPGCPSIGPKTANKVLDEECSWDAVVRTYEKKGFTEADALVMARVARICTSADFNHKTQEVRLWTPPAGA